ncbi:hypothetical protein DERF_010035 [Dermatophagoides farinae]|uniref:Uncharacterized protein n=1 Tax=Dermatophagoides farinae TaxID=6954 RepID=A0A922L1J6_DERFA|nr:hypothetical protein DERF_010035 [Dermatophagoides farinae]
MLIDFNSGVNFIDVRDAYGLFACLMAGRLAWLIIIMMMGEMNTTSTQQQQPNGTKRDEKKTEK